MCTSFLKNKKKALYISAKEEHISNSSVNCIKHEHIHQGDQSEKRMERIEKERK